MQCQRLLKQVKGWYIHVSNETMAPARMVAFIEKHAAECDICQEDPDLQEEIEKITEMILPESKIPKAVRMQREQEEIAKREAEEESEEGNVDESVEVNEESEGGNADESVKVNEENEVTE